MRALENNMKEMLTNSLLELEKQIKCDVLCYLGEIVDGLERVFVEIIENLKKDSQNDTLAIVLTTGGGSARAVERFVNIVRHNYQKVIFIVPDYAYSAGTIFCMSGDEIWMDYSSVLGPIDPQVPNKEGKFVPALGYLDKINSLIEKAQKGQLTDAEFIILKEFDLAELRAYEQAKELTVSLLKKWLVKYKFKNWDNHKDGSPVTEKDKEDRAKKIADALGDNKKWNSHGRPIDIKELEELRLTIDDYSDDDKRKTVIRNYYNLMRDYVEKNKQIRIFIHTRKFI